MKRFQALLSIALLVLLAACGSNGEQTARKAPKAPKAPAAAGLSEWQIEHGIGPVTEDLQLGQVEAAMAEKGAQIFEAKCSACHKLDERYVGPALRGVVERRTPEFVMNMILNPNEMVQKHPEVKKMLAQYYTPMTFQNVTREETRAILEFLRREAALQPVSSNQK